MVDVDVDGGDDEGFWRRRVLEMARPLSASPMEMSDRGGLPVEVRYWRFSALRRRRVAIWCFRVDRWLAFASRDWSLLRSSARFAVRVRRRACSWSMRDCFACDSLRKDDSVSAINVLSAVVFN